MIRGIDPGGMKSAYEEAKGDFYVQMGDLESAYTAYQGAILSDQSQDSRIAAILRLKAYKSPAKVPASAEVNVAVEEVEIEVEEKSGEVE